MAASVPMRCGAKPVTRAEAEAWYWQRWAETAGTLYPDPLPGLLLWVMDRRSGAGVGRAQSPDTVQSPETKSDT